MANYTCSKCGNDNLLGNEVRLWGRKIWCKPCYNAYSRPKNKRYYTGGISSKLWHKFYHLARKYGISQEDFKKKVDLQLNGCAICLQPFTENKKISVDHDHKTNVVRDLLCYRCNTILGLVNDDEELLFDLIEYLKRHSLKKAS